MIGISAKQRLTKYALAAWLIAALSGCVFDKYAAEVGYRNGEGVTWDIWGDFTSLDDCREAAISRFNSLNFESPGRATSWACLLKDGSGGFESRHR